MESLAASRRRGQPKAPGAAGTAHRMDSFPISAVSEVLLYPRGASESTKSLVLDCLALLREGKVRCWIAPEEQEEYQKEIEAGLLSVPAEGVELGMGLEVDLVVALGGDGTLLRASRCVRGQDIPVVGINAGDLGFLTHVPREHYRSALQQAMRGELRWEPRLGMQVEVRRGETTIFREMAYNDAYVKHGAMPRLLRLATYIGQQFVATYIADGLIVSTPMGSTAYNLAAGGPMLEPGLDALTITPLCPHSLTLRPVVCSASNGIRVVFDGPDRGANAYLTVDGQRNFELQPGDEVRIDKAQKPLRLVSPRDSVFQVLAAKLGWNDGGLEKRRMAHSHGPADAPDAAPADP